MTSQYGAYALRTGYARLQARTLVHTSTLPGTHTHVLTRARARTHTHTNRQIYNIYCFSRSTTIRENALVALYVHCLSCSNYIRPSGKLEYRNLDYRGKTVCIINFQCMRTCVSQNKINSNKNRLLNGRVLLINVTKRLCT